MASLRVLKQLTRAVSDPLTVRVTQGTLRGAVASSKLGGDYISFRGVPYAKPPVGALRFKAPQAPEAWSGVRDAIQEGEVSVQRDLYTQKMRGSEDCLFLNIHTPKLPEDCDHILKPVIVWIPGGSFTSGHGNADVYGPDFIIREDVILVTINYRVGVLGFLSLEEAGISGNAGLKDQVFALRWLKENIANFGGDPDNVTLCGDSAGAASVNYHLLSPMSKGLFTRAVALSGSVLNPYAFMDTATSHNRAFTLAEAVGLKTNQPDKVLDLFMNMPAVEIAKNVNKALNKIDNKKGLAFPFLPTVERNPQTGDEVFLPDTPINMLANGDFQKLPYMSGVSSHEGALLLRNILSDPKLMIPLEKEFERCITMPLDLNIERHSDASRALAEEVKQFYFGDGPISEKHILNYCNLMTDVFFTNCVHQTTCKNVQFSEHPTYYFEFGFGGSFGLFKKFIGAKNLPGASHLDIVCYLFKHSLVKYDLPPDSKEIKIQNALVKMLTNFAKVGNPTPQSDSTLSLNWDPATAENKMAFLEITDDLAMKTERVKERTEFWADKFRRYGHKYETSLCE